MQNRTAPPEFGEADLIRLRSESARITSNLSDVLHPLEKLFDILEPEFLFARALILPEDA